MSKSYHILEELKNNYPIEQFQKITDKVQKNHSPYFASDTTALKICRKIEYAIECLYDITISFHDVGKLNESGKIRDVFYSINTHIPNEKDFLSLNYPLKMEYKMHVKAIRKAMELAHRNNFEIKSL